MATFVKSYKGFKIKKTTKRDNSTSEYWVIKPSWDTVSPIWEDSTLEHCMEWIDSYEE